MSLTFTYEEVSNRFDQFVRGFMSFEKDVEKTKLLPHYWIVSVPSKDFKVVITCECTNRFHGIEQWGLKQRNLRGMKN